MRRDPSSKHIAQNKLGESQGSRDLIGRRGRPRNELAAPQEGSNVVGLPIRSDPRHWLHLHPQAAERDDALNWKFASPLPALGRAVLDAVYAMSASDGPLKSYGSARSCMLSVKPFFNWLAEQPTLPDGSHIGENNTHLTPKMFVAYKRHQTERADKGQIKSRTAYAYKGEILRVLRFMWRANTNIFGCSWTEADFQNDDFKQDGTPAEPYTSAEARRILDQCTAIIRARHDKTEEHDQRLVQLAAYCSTALHLGIEPECLARLTHDSVKGDGAKGRMRVKYIKQRGGGGSGYRKSRITNPAKGAARGGDEEEEELEATGTTLHDAGGVLALLRDAAAERHAVRPDAAALLGNEPLFWVECDAKAFRWFSIDLYERGLRGDDGQELMLRRPRLHPTWRAARTTSRGGRSNIDARDNGRDVRAAHYLERGFLKARYEDAILSAQDKALDYTLQPVVVDLSDEASNDDIAAAAVASKVPTGQITSALTGETDLWLASCRDFTNSPFAPAGKPCTRPFHGCILCSNALITRRSLPFILAFKEHMVGRYREMPLDEWELLYGTSYGQIVHQIEPKFSPDTIAEALRIMRGMDLLLHIPPELTQ